MLYYRLHLFLYLYNFVYKIFQQYKWDPLSRLTSDFYSHKAHMARILNTWYISFETLFSFTLQSVIHNIIQGAWNPRYTLLSVNLFRLYRELIQLVAMMDGYYPSWIADLYKILCLSWDLVTPLLPVLESCMNSRKISLHVTRFTFSNFHIQERV